MTNPKLFVSYSWTNPDHERWVLALSTELRESGVDVILDKWDLKEGHDAHAFMEQMVTDPEINKVILICDKAYVEKADGRSHGVGTEAQIISGEIYAKKDQSKFVAIVRERDSEGNAYLPAYYRSRIYIDLSDPSTYSENFEQLLRWIYDKPLHAKPKLGIQPAFLCQPENTVFLGTTSRFKRAIDALKNNRDNADGTVSEYFSTLASNFESLRISDEVQEFDDAVIESLESFLPYRNEAVEVFITISQYRDTAPIRGIIHRFFEELIPYLDRPQHVTTYRDWDFDNFKFIIHELFLYAISSMIRYERFESAAYLMRNQYYVFGRSDYGRDAMVSFEVFRQHMKSLKHRNERLQLRRLSVRADLLDQRCKAIGLSFRHLMQADFILFIRDYLDRPEESWHWWPETLLYVDRHSGPFEVFARARSSGYFENVKELFDIDSKEPLNNLIQTFEANRRQLPRWEFETFNPRVILGLDELATKP